MKVLISIALFVAAVIAAFAVFLLWGLPAVFLLLAAIVLSGTIALLWSSLANLAGDTDMSFEEALSLAAPTAEEEQKRAVLRALKDLEYELFVGKISQEDFEQLSAEYRQKARHYIAVADSSLGEKKELAEKRLARKLNESAKKKSARRRSKKKSSKTRKTGPENDQRSAEINEEQKRVTRTQPSSPKTSSADSTVPPAKESTDAEEKQS